MLTDEETALRNRLLEKLKPAFSEVDKRHFFKRKVCNKKRFTKKEAKTVLNFIIQGKGKHDKRRKEVRIYQCPICNTYHLTKKAKS